MYPVHVLLQLGWYRISITWLGGGSYKGIEKRKGDIDHTKEKRGREGYIQRVKYYSTTVATVYIQYVCVVHDTGRTKILSLL